MIAAANQNHQPASGKLAVNIMHFARVLREAGLPVGPGYVLDALDAAMSGTLRSREDFYWTLHSVFIKRRDQKEVFDQAFHAAACVEQDGDLHERTFRFLCGRC